MTKQTGRNVLLTAGAWSMSGAVATFIALVLIPLNNRLTFQGESGTVIMWVWSGVPELVTAVAATIVVLWLIETKKPYGWVGALAGLYLYTGVMDAMRTLGGFQSTPMTVDYVGIAIEGLLPFSACMVAGVWHRRRRVVETADGRLDTDTAIR